LFAFTYSVRQLSNRSCDGDLPCLSRVVDPILSARDNASAAEAFSSFKTTMRTRVASAQFEEELKKRLSDSVPECAFGKVELSAVGQCPPKAHIELLFSQWLISNGYESRMTTDLKNTIFSLVSSCWLGCRLKRRAGDMANNADTAVEVDIEMVRRYVAILCDSPWCSQTVSVSSIPGPIRKFSLTFFSPDLLYTVLGIVVECLLIIACVVVGFVIVVVWRVARDALIYLVLVSLLVVAEIMLLVWWVTAIQTEFLPDKVVANLLVLREIIHVVFFVVVLVLSLNWFFALFELLGQKALSSRVELAIRIVVLTVACSMIVCSVALSLLFPELPTNDFSPQNAAFAFQMILRTSSVSMCLFLLVCSVIGFVVVKRDARSSQQAIGGLLKMVIVSVVFATTATFQFAFFCIQKAPYLGAGYYYIPPWFEFGLVIILSHLILIAALLYLIAKASQGFVRHKPDASVELLNKSLLSKEERIPKAYEI
jgi:hypothetical protein